MDIGKKVFVKNCAQAQKYPNLICLFGRQTSQVPGNAFTGANNDQNTAGGNNIFDVYQANPTKYIPGAKFVFDGIKRKY